MQENLKIIADYLPQHVRNSLLRMPDTDFVQEVRLRCGRPAAVSAGIREQFLTETGRLTANPAEARNLTPEEIARSFQAVVSYSVYSHEQDLSEGFVTIRGGCRVGVCGSAVRNGETIRSIRSISGLNFRIASAHPGIAEKVWNQTGQQGGLLIAGTVGSGKTTFLRDLCRLMGNAFRTALIDERGELAAVRNGVPQYDIGSMTDVLDGYPRAAGILTALRVLTPVYILCDEISTKEDTCAILQAAGCGVQFAASAHAGSPEDLLCRPVIQPLLTARVFRYAIFLDSQQKVRRVQAL